MTKMESHKTKKLLHNKGNNQPSKEKVQSGRESLPATHMRELITRIYKELKKRSRNKQPN